MTTDTLEASDLDIPKVLPYLHSRTALFIVDMQHDFVGTEGTMRVPGAFKIVEKCKGWYKLAYFSRWPIFVSMDWHPADHCSFIPNGGNHPIHCIQGWKGANLHAGLFITPAHVYMVKKGMASSPDPKTLFDGKVLENEGVESDPSWLLKAHSVKNVFVTGVAVEYTIRDTVQELVDRGFSVILPSDAVAGMHPAGIERTLEEFRGWGVVVL